MNHNLKLAVELYSLGLLRLELPISDKRFSAQIPYPAAKKDFAASFAKRRYQSVVQDLKKAEPEKCNARYASRSHSKSPRKGYFIHGGDRGEHIE